MSLQGTNLEHARRRNRRVAFEAVLKHGPLSRSEIARMTGLTSQTASNIAGELIALGLIKETGRRLGRKGQPATEYVVDEEGAYTIGIHLDQNQLVGLLVDVLGHIVARTALPIARQNPGEVLPLVERAVDGLVNGNDEIRRRLLGLGAVMPGFFESGTFASRGPLTMEGWLDFPLAQELSGRLNLPVFVDNDATAAAIGESLYGFGQTHPTFIYIYFGLGLGGGIVIDGRPFTGVRQRAAELGHLIVNPGGKPCACGNRGCLERYVSLHSAYEAILQTENEWQGASPELLLKAFQTGNNALAKWLDDAAYYLRIAVNGLENLFDPSGIVVGGLLPDPILTALVEKTFPLLPSSAADPGTRGARLIKGDVRFDTPAAGAAALPMSRLLHPLAKEDGPELENAAGAGLFGAL